MVRKISWKEMFERYEELEAMTREERIGVLGEEWNYIFEGLSNPYAKKKKSGCDSGACDISNHKEEQA